LVNCAPNFGLPEPARVTHTVEIDLVRLVGTVIGVDYAKEIQVVCDAVAAVTRVDRVHGDVGADRRARSARFKSWGRRGRRGRRNRGNHVCAPNPPAACAGICGTVVARGRIAIPDVTVVAVCP
jgi:hypothetical protein